MPPIRPDDHAYRFRPAMLRELRERLNLTQAQMAHLLEIPVNTLSRWETGANLPDANALAAIHSIAADRGVTPQFFEERRKTVSKSRKRENRIVDWDFQNLEISDDEIQDTADELIEYMDCVYGRSSQDVLSAYVSTGIGGTRGFESSPQVQALKKADFDIFPCHQDADRRIIEDARDILNSTSDFNPKESAYVLISDDGDYAGMLKSFRSAGFDTFVVGTDECNAKLINAVGKDHFIPLNRPFVVLKCLEVARELKGKTINKANFGDLCRRKLADNGLDLDEIDDIMENTGFSLNRPYASALQHMVSMGIVKISQVDNDPNRITITEIKR